MYDGKTCPRSFVPVPFVLSRPVPVRFVLRSWTENPKFRIHSKA